MEKVKMNKYVIKNEFCNVSLDEFSKNIEKVLLYEFPNYCFVGKDNKILKDVKVGQKLEYIEIADFFDTFDEAKANLPKNFIKYSATNSCYLISGYSIYNVQLAKSNKKDTYQIVMIDCLEDFVYDVLEQYKQKKW